MSEYRNKINKNILYEFLLCDESEMGNIHIDEVYKVIDIVMHKYYSAYVGFSKDLKAETFALILDRRKGFDPDRDAYNYIFTQARNEIGNNIYRWKKETSIEDDLNVREQGSEIDYDNLDIPPACLKYAHYLTGEADFTTKRIARKDVADMVIYLKVMENKAVQPVPEYFKNRKNVEAILYKLLKDIIDYE